MMGTVRDGGPVSYYTDRMLKNRDQLVEGSCFYTRWSACSVIRFVSISAKFGICTVVGLNGTLVEAKKRTFKCPKCVS